MEPQDLATDSAGNVVMKGGFQGTLYFGNLQLSSASDLSGYVVKLDAAMGNPLWGRNVVPSQSSTVDDAGNVLLAGSFYGTLNVDGTVLTHTNGSGYAELFVTKLSGSTGMALWSRSLGEAQTDETQALVRADPAGNALVLSWISRPTQSFRLTKLDAQGQELWSRERGPQNADLLVPWDLSFDASGNMLLSMRFMGQMDFGGGLDVPPGWWVSTTLAWYDANGGYLTHRHFFQDPGDLVAAGAAFDAAGNVVLGGSIRGTVDLGTGPVGRLVLQGLPAETRPHAVSEREGPLE